MCFDGNGNEVRANADSVATGINVTVADIGVLRDVRISAPAQRIAVAVATDTLLQSTHHGFLDVPGHGPTIAYISPQLKGSLLSISPPLPRERPVWFEIMRCVRLHELCRRERAREHF